MAVNNFVDCPSFLRDYLFYNQTIKGLSNRTIVGYHIDLRTFLRFVCMQKKLCDADIAFKEIKIIDITIDVLKAITLSDVYEFLHYIASERSNSAVTRARKVSSIRSFFNYLTVKVNLLPHNPIKELELPSTKKTLPKYLTLEQCLELLSHVDGLNKQRDYCIFTLFLNCGMRLSELVGMNLTDISENTIRLRGKGNKERIIYLNEACLLAIESYKTVRGQLVHILEQHKNALFISRNGNRISRRRVQEIVENNLKLIGLGQAGLSTHKLRHTAATIMYQHGQVDIKVLQEILGHESLATTQIYTHTSSEQMEKAANSTPLGKVKSKI